MESYHHQMTSIFQCSLQAMLNQVGLAAIVTNEVLLKPLLPQYHGLIVFKNKIGIKYARIFHTEKASLDHQYQIYMK